MQFDKFTHKSQETIQAAQQLAQDSNHQEIQVEHLVKTILTQPESVVVPVLKKLGVDPSLLLNDVNQLLKDIPQVFGQGTGQSYISQDLKKLFDASFSVFGSFQKCISIFNNSSSFFMNFLNSVISFSSSIPACFLL